MEGSLKETKQVSLFAECISTTNENDPEISNPIYHFYLALKGAPQGIKAEHGDWFYQCYHSRKKTLRITKKMKYNLNGKVYIPSVNLSAFGLIFLILSGLLENLRSCSPNMFKFYSYLKDCTPQVPLSMEKEKIMSDDIELLSVKLAEITSHNAMTLVNSHSRIYSCSNRRKLQYTKFLFVIMFSVLLSLFRNHGTRTNSNTCWPGGSSHQTNHLIK